MTSLIRQLRLLLLGLWLGAAVFFGAAVAPALFGVLRGAGLPNANELAGSIVTRLLAIINQGGFEIGLFLFVTAFFVNRDRNRLFRLTEIISITILTVMTAISHWIISPRMMAIRASLAAPIDQIAPGDPRRLTFDSLHRYSVAAMAVAIIAALLTFVLNQTASFRKN